MMLQFSKEENELLKKYAFEKGKAVEEVVRCAILEKIEDEEDAQLADEVYEEYLKDPKTISFTDFLKEMED